MDVLTTIAARRSIRAFKPIPEPDEGLQRWLGERGQLVAAVSFGYPDESPDARPRLSVAQVSRTL